MDAIPNFPNGHDTELQTQAAFTIAPLASGYIIRRLAVEDNYSRILLPDFIVRCIKFLEKYQVEMDDAWLTQTIYTNFQAGCRDALMLVALDKQEKIVAHFLAIVQMMGKEQVLYVLQVESDVKSPQLLKEGRGFLKTWKKWRGLKKTVYMALNERVMRLWRKQGARVHRYLMVEED